MDQELGLGNMNGHSVGVLMRELVRRAITFIRTKRMAFEVSLRLGIEGSIKAVSTDADSMAQEIIVSAIREHFPDAGIIAEEKALNILPKNGCRAYFTVDPICGTKAFIRRQSHGVGSMIALVIDGEIVSVCIGDVNTQELYYYHPGSEYVHRLTESDVNQDLSLPHDGKDLSDQYAILRDPPECGYSGLSRELIYSGVFKSYLVDGGSIGIWLARLWKREVGAALIPPSWETPWDTTPILGISEKLGYYFLRPYGNCWRRFSLKPSTEKHKRDHDLLIVHGNNLKDIPRVLDR